MVRFGSTSWIVCLATTLGFFITHLVGVSLVMSWICFTSWVGVSSSSITSLSTGAEIFASLTTLPPLSLKISADLMVLSSFSGLYAIYKKPLVSLQLIRRRTKYHCNFIFNTSCCLILDSACP